jgi:hypothetical protein
MPKLGNKSKVYKTKSKKRSFKQSKRFKKSPRKRRSLKLQSGLRGGSIDDSEKYKDRGIDPEKSGFVEYLQKTPYKLASYFDSTAKSTAGFIRKTFGL